MNAAWLDRMRRLRRARPPELAGGRWLETRAGRLRAIERGDPTAPPVLLVPDPPNGLEQLAPLVDDLARDHRVLAVEAPGFGYSGTAPGYGFGLEAVADLLVELLEGLRQPAVVGVTCVVTLAALRAANRRPDLVRGLVLGQTAGPAELLAWARRVDRFPLASSFQALRRADLRPEGLTSQAPAVVLFGTADRTHRRTDPASVLGLVPRAELRRLEGCGHFPDLERVADFARALREVGGR